MDDLEQAFSALGVLDRQWSRIPSLVLSGDGLVAGSFWLIFLVLKANPHSASTICVAKEQSVISTGPYALVRHPMYAGCLPLVVDGSTRAGSWWRLWSPVPLLLALGLRLLNEEQFLRWSLPGYAEYTARVRYR